MTERRIRPWLSWAWVITDRDSQCCLWMNPRLGTLAPLSWRTGPGVTTETPYPSGLSVALLTSTYAEEALGSEIGDPMRYQEQPRAPMAARVHWRHRARGVLLGMVALIGPAGS